MDMLYSRDKIILIICLLAVGATCRAQYHPTYSQYMFNGLALNPAYAGSNESLNVALIYKSSQWGNSVDGAPVTQTVVGDFPLDKPQTSVGMMIFTDKILSIRTSGAYFAYSYHVKTNIGKLYLGMQAGFDLQNEDQSGHKLENPNDHLFTSGKNNNFMPNAGVGTYFYKSNFFAGISIPQILAYSPKKADSYKVKPSLTNSKLLCGIVVPTPISLKIKPSTLVQFKGKNVLYDLNCNFAIFNEILEFGASWRSSNTLVGLLQIRISQLRIGYAYDYALEKLEANNTTHEIMLRLDMRIRVKAASPLYF